MSQLDRHLTIFEPPCSRSLAEDPDDDDEDDEGDGEDDPDEDEDDDQEDGEETWWVAPEA